MKLQATIQKHMLVFPNEQYARFQMSKLEGKKVTVEIKKVFNKRSQAQNNYYWLCLEEISTHTGHTPEELHEIFKVLYLPKTITWRGKRLPMVRSTSELSTGQFIPYMNEITREASEMGIVLPSIEEYKELIDSAITK